MKKLLFALALLILTSQGAFAITYPSCSNGGSINNGKSGDDSFSTNGWCVDGYGVLTPKTSTVSSTQPNSQGGMAVPVSLVTGTYGPQTTFDALLAQQTGTIFVDTGSYSLTTNGVNGVALTSMVTIDTLVGRGGHYVLPAAYPGETFTIVSGTKSVITVDTLTPALANAMTAQYGTPTATASGLTAADTIEFSPVNTAMTAGQSLQSGGGAGDSITLVSPYAGMWVVTSMTGVSKSTTIDTLWTVISTQ